jgi:hypothetical protein
LLFTPSVVSNVIFTLVVIQESEVAASAGALSASAKPKAAIISERVHICFMALLLYV